MGSGDTAPHILSVSNRWRRGVSFMLRLLYSPRKTPRYTFDKRLSEPYGARGEHKSLTVPEIE
jgi:hypothetical protein